MKDTSDWIGFTLKPEHVEVVLLNLYLKKYIEEWLNDNSKKDEWYFKIDRYSPKQNNWVSVADQGFVTFLKSKQVLLFKCPKTALLFKLTWM